MKPKTMLFLVIILGIFVGVSLLMQQLKKPSVSQKSRLGGELLEAFPVNDITHVTIQSDEGTVQLGKVDDKWVVKSRYNYPVDFKKLIDFVKKWKEAKIGRSFKASEASLARMQLIPPDNADAQEDQKGVRVTFKKDDDSVIANIITGKVRENEQRASGGQYVRVGDTETVFLTDKNFKYMTKDSKGWLDKELLDIKDEDIQKIVYTDFEGKKVYTIQREKKGEDARLINVPEGRTPKKSEVNSTLRALSSLRIEDVENPSEKQTDKTTIDKMVFYLFNGKVITIYPEKKFKNNEDVHCLRVEVAFQKPPEPEKPKEEEPPVATDDVTPIPEEDAESEADDDKKEEKSPEELAYEAETQNKEMSGWTYILAKWKYENFISNIEELLEEKKDEAEQPAETKE
ncbi:MAG: hypothetical protein OMM_02849 [Candidatus Magnetoglobus multicellularis str. Araruama]|uniref:DUF4340 domain-containing protein n=1 Tax=Candidatus Magnetoglobus multicellularis str. Araruama TaxID=890399 RepID=A0A1V1P874_9BACT|nr:MAG: hypothetical protein OMM_02849 [Candidatus Magnetoglobus multicellularis str. Araruama]